MEIIYGDKELIYGHYHIKMTSKVNVSFENHPAETDQPEL